MPSEDWSSKTVIEPVTGRIHRLYTFKGKPARRLELATPLAKQAAGYALIDHDLERVRSWLDQIDSLLSAETLEPPRKYALGANRQTFDLIKALYVASLAFYGKAFSQCEGRKIKLDRRQIAESFWPVHDQCIALRNNFVAHSGAMAVESARMIIAIPLSAKKSGIIKLFQEVDQPDYMPAESEQHDLPDLVNHVQGVVQAKLTQLKQKLEAECGQDEDLLKRIRRDA